MRCLRCQHGEDASGGHTAAFYLQSISQLVEKFVSVRNGDGLTDGPLLGSSVRDM